MGLRLWAAPLLVVGVLAVPAFGNPNDGGLLPGCGPSGGRPAKCASAPEIDAGSGLAAMAAILAALAFALERRRKI